MGNYRGGSRTGGHASVHLGNLQEAIKLVDGAGSGIDADLFDGKDSSEYTPSSHTSVAATTTVLGHVKTGDGVAVSSGTISVDVGDGVILSGTSPNKKVVADVDGTSIVLTGTTPNKKISHADTSSQASISNTGAAVIQSVTLDTYGHVTAMSSKTITTGDINAVPTSDVVTTATANKILKLDANSKLPASITGDSDTVDGLHATSFMRSDANTSTTGTMSVGGRLTVNADVLFQNNALIAADGGVSNVDHIWHDDAGAGSNETVGTWHFVSDLAYKANGNAGIRCGSIYATSTATNYFAGKLGLGITSASAKLHVRNASVSNVHVDLYTTTLIEDGESRVQIVSGDSGQGGSALILSTAPSTGDNKHWTMHHAGLDDGNRLDFGYSTSTASGAQVIDYNNPKLTILNTGNVGVGVTNPNAKLEVKGDLYLSKSTTNGLKIYDTSDNVHIDMVKTADTSKVGARILLDGWGAATDVKGSIRFLTANSSDSGATNGLTERLTVLENGNVGIGVQLPSQRLDVTGTVRFAAANPPGLIIERTGSSVNANMEFKHTGSSIFIGHGTSGYFQIKQDADTSSGVFKVQASTGNTTVNDLTANGVIRTSKMTWQAVFAPGESKKNIVHNLGTTNYMVALGANSVVRHAAWENKFTNTVDIVLDSSYSDDTILVDVILMAY